MRIQYRADVVATAKSFNLDPKIVAALVMTESGGNPWAWNPEPRYHYFWDVKHNQPFRVLTSAEVALKSPPADFTAKSGDPDQEWWGQQASWGLMQVMGAVAREIGFAGPYLTELCDPVKNLVIGCRRFSRLLEWSQGNTAQALAAYNGGEGGNASAPFRNQAYANLVLHAAEVVEI